MSDFDVLLAPGVVFRIVRAYPTSKEVREETGIYMNFSAKVFFVNKQDETPILSLNALSIRVNRDNVPFIASMGQKIDNGMIWSIQFYPGAAQDKDQAARQENFVSKVINAATEFAAVAKQQYLERKNANQIPEVLRKISEV